MADTIAQLVGVDISKDTLDVYLHPASIARRFANTRAGRSRVIAWLAEFAIARVVFEPNGPYHHAFERRLAEAAMLARLAALLKPPVRSVVSQRLDDMKELIVARRALIEEIEDRVAALQR